MKICMLARAVPSHSRGGVEDHTWLLSTGIARRAHEVTLLTTAHPDGRREEYDGGVKIIYLPEAPPTRYGRSWWSASVAKVLELHHTSPFDILHSQGIAGYAILSRRLNEKLNLPTVISFHGTHWDELKTRILHFFSPNPIRLAKNFAAVTYVARNYFWWDLRLAPRADAVIATSNEQARVISRYYFITHHKLFKVFNGMDLRLFTPAEPDEQLRSTLGIKPGKRILLCAARLIRDKGVQHVVASLPDILKVFHDCTLIIIGDGGYRPKLEKMVKRLQLSSIVIFTGSVDFDKLPGYFRLCDVFINATIQQNGYDLTMVEAMACEKVVIASDIGSTPTLIQHGVEGILVASGDRATLAQQVIEVLGNESLRKEMGRKARQKVLSTFSLESMVDGTLQVYDSLVQNSARSIGHKHTRTMVG